ncbi:phage tail tape measure protein [Vibrio parahaemolyticus]|uniref:phage tail tape measure protein n=1 Tax=Vibrio parahaemolyticus TaxID=670 RepID=UPI000543FBB0|nr:phage tail tape measure protein [Vibrio parahaemolyticus]EGR3300031.1 phage tail tape measure protein [Vibrio parahaemolyticus]EGR3316970.1 phage tail tape measure protein [Vibrio parahaemolyticus]KHF03858.1 tail tape measure protein [Vibrio parahaemolyticus]TOM01845.1 phage tail tape measure protein [Vibrio parahaemolyticus]
MLPEALTFRVGLINQISKPLGNIQRQLNDVTNTYRKGTHTMMAGTAGMVGAGFALQNALMPAIEMDRVLGEVKSLGVVDEQLQQLSDTALNFSVDYGKSATEFVAASYDIQSAISGLAGNELSEFTRASGVLAAATKADTSTITNYVGTMYGIFQNSANQMGKADWVNMLGGQTARAVQMFKTTGDQMSAAFTSVGASATSVGVGMTEQMAILGTLQATMSGSEAGTKYRAFLAGAAKAQDALNMSFTDAQGQLLPIVDILNQIKGRYGDTISVAEAAELSKAFGTQEATAMIQLLMQNTDGLANSIDELGKVNGLDVAEQMAGAMTDQWERLEQGVFAVRAAFGQALLPVILPVVEMFANGAKEIMLWTKLFPNITKYIGLAAVALLGLVAVGGMITVLTGAVTVAWATFGLGVTAIKGVTLAMWSFSKSTMAAVWSVVKLTAALLANPITWVVIGIVALIGAVAALVYYWDDLKAAFLTFTTMAKQGWNDFLFAMQNTAAFQAVTGLAESMRNAFMSVFNWIIGKYNAVMDMVKSVTDWIPGFGGDDDTKVKSTSVNGAASRLQVQPGGAAKNIASYQTSSTNYGGVAIYPTYMNSPQDMASEIEMAAG